MVLSTYFKPQIIFLKYQDIKCIYFVKILKIETVVYYPLISSWRPNLLNKTPGFVSLLRSWWQRKEDGLSRAVASHRYYSLMVQIYIYIVLQFAEKHWEDKNQHMEKITAGKSFWMCHFTTTWISICPHSVELQMLMSSIQIQRQQQWIFLSLSWGLQWRLENYH